LVLAGLLTRLINKGQPGDGRGWRAIDWIGLDWIGLDWIGLDWIGLDWIGLDWIGLDWIGLDWIGRNTKKTGACWHVPVFLTTVKQLA